MSTTNTRMRKLLLRDAELTIDKDSSLYVMNRTNEPGAINMTCTDRNGVRIPVVIPNTFIPIDMSNFVPKENLLRDSSFRKLVQSGAVIIVHSEDAENAIKNNPRAKKEQDRIYAVNADLQDDVGSGGEFVEIGTERNREPERVITENDNIAPFALGVVERSKDSGDDVQDILSDIESRAYSLTANDLDYITNNVSSVEIKDFVQKLREEV